MTPAFPTMRPRTIEGISAVLLPYSADGHMDLAAYQALVARTYDAGIVPAVNMDTGYTNLLTGEERARVLAAAREVAGGRTFVAGAFIEGEPGDPVALYRREIAAITRAGGTPILFQCSALVRAGDEEVVRIYSEALAGCDKAYAFELGRMFAPFGRIYSVDLFARLMEIPPIAGAKHSSLDRQLEWDRLALRDRVRPDFRIYTGNDLAIDMVFFGSDYLLGLSAFAIEAFAQRDAWWAAGDARAFRLNDVLQYLGHLAFRAPVPAYKHTCAQFLALRGRIPASAPHPQGVRRPDSDLPLLEQISADLDVAAGGGGEGVPPADDHVAAGLVRPSAGERRTRPAPTSTSRPSAGEGVPPADDHVAAGLVRPFAGERRTSPTPTSRPSAGERRTSPAPTSPPTSDAELTE